MYCLLLYLVESALTAAGISIVSAVPGANAFSLTYADRTIAVGDNSTPTIVGANGTMLYISNNSNSNCKMQLLE